MGKTLLQMLADIFGKNIFSKTIGTRTNVIKLPSADKRRLFKNDLDINRATESQTETIKKELEDLIPDIPKMNDMEKLTLEGNVRRLYNKLFPQETSGEVIDIATKKKVTGEGLESLKEKAGIPEGVEPGSLMDRLNKAVQKLQGQKEKLDLQLKEMESPLKPSGMDLTTGLTRTAARKILDRAGIKVPDKADPIEVFEKNFGGDALMDVKNVAEEMIEIESMGKATKSMDEILEKSGMFNIKKNPDAPKGMSDEELEKILKSKKPTEPEEFNTGGRVHAREGYVSGLGKKVWQFFKPFGSKLSSVNKMDAAIYGSEGIASLMDILSTYGIGFADGGRVNFSKGTTIIMGIINAIKKLKPIDAMKEMNEVVAKRGKYKNLDDDQVKKIFDETNDHIFEREVKPTEFDMSFDEAAEELAAAGAPKAAERFALKKKYPGIDERLLTNIIDDTNPDRKARVLAELDQAMELMKRDISSDEVIDILKNQSRTKQAEGGLSYLMGF